MEIAYWPMMLLLGGFAVATAVYFVLAKSPLIALVALCPLLPAWAGHKERINKKGRSLRLDEIGVTSLREGRMEWSVAWPDYCGTIQVSGFDPPLPCHHKIRSEIQALPPFSFENRVSACSNDPG